MDTSNKTQKTAEIDMVIAFGVISRQNGKVLAGFLGRKHQLCLLFEPFFITVSH